MSWQASAWAIEQQEIKSPGARHVLLCMANYADASGKAAFPSVHRLARDTGMSVRAVQYNLRKLEQTMLIRKGDQAIVKVKIKRVGYYPISYDLQIRGAINAPHSDEGCNPRQGGVQSVQKRGAPIASDPPSDPPLTKEVKREQIEALKKKCRMPLIRETS